jgi:hypothetical protein
MTPFPAQMGGNAGLQYQQQMMQMQLSQYQAAIGMQRAAADQASNQLRAEQGLMSEYYSLVYRMNQISSGGGLGGGGLGSGGLGGGGFGGGGGGSFGLGLSLGPLNGGSYGGGYGVGLVGGYGVGPSVGGSVPGRTR